MRNVDIQEVAAILEGNYPEVQIAYVFGSAKNGTARETWTTNIAWRNAFMVNQTIVQRWMKPRSEHSP